MKIEQWPIGRPKPYPKNPRKIPAAAVQKVAASIREFGFQQPIVVDRKGVVIVGHVRLLAAQEIGLKEVPVHVAQNLTPEQVRTYRLADNRTADEALWNPELLAEELRALEQAGIDLAASAFDDHQLLRLLGEMDRDNMEIRPPERPVSQHGDLWQLGSHRLLCGDATEADDVTRLLDGTKPLLMVTDPPYTPDYDSSHRLRHGKEAQRLSTHVYKGITSEELKNTWPLFPGNIIYIWIGSAYLPETVSELRSLGFDFRNEIIWAKPCMVINRGHYQFAHEPCIYAVRRGKTARWRGGRNQSTLWAHPNASGFLATDEERTPHAGQKPLELMRRPIVNHLRKGEAVYDPFVGSGTTIIAAEKEGRVCFAMDIDPAYIDIAILRWQKLTDAKARLDGGGTFGSVSKSRAKHGEKAKSA